MSIYKLFAENGLNLLYEPKKAVIAEGFVADFVHFDRKSKGNNVLVEKTNEKILPITYTPDFIYKGKNICYIIEVKGFSNDTFPLKKKLFFRLLNDKCKDKVVFSMLYNLKNAKQLIDYIKAKEDES